ncbi:MAG: AMP-binding protein [Treponema sp.]|nr:AMP-binding protein [Treponema sp.]
MRINFYNEFAKTVENKPQKIAVYDGDASVSFSQLHERELKLAECISNANGNKIKTPVGVFLQKSTDSIAADIGIIHTGNFYMNLDVKYPEERLSNIFKIVEPSCLVTSSKYKAILEKIDATIPLIVVDEITNNSISKEIEKRLSDNLSKLIDTDPLCLINTSGSTGTPKGVVLNHRSFYDFLDCSVETWNLGDDEILSSLSPAIFDIFSYELTLLMAKSAAIMIVPENFAMFPVRILELMNKHKATFLFWVPTIMVNIANMGLLDKVDIPSLKHIWFAGEVFPTKQFNVWYRKFKGQARFVNLYGPIEITLDCTWFEITKEYDENKPLPIGFACKNTDILILNDKNELVGKNEEGELCVRGTGLAMGYYNNLEKTAAAFVQNPLNGSYPELIYRTGDVALVNDEGEIIFKGRKDTLIKHSGYRIELSEIEHIIMNKLKLVKNCCVVYNWSKKEITLIYENDTELDVAALRKQLALDLPKYMMPTAYIYMKELPRGGTGKIDRALLNKQVNQG